MSSLVPSSDDTQHLTFVPNDNTPPFIKRKVTFEELLPASRGSLTHMGLKSASIKSNGPWRARCPINQWRFLQIPNGNTIGRSLFGTGRRPITENIFDAFQQERALQKGNCKHKSRLCKLLLPPGPALGHPAAAYRKT